MPDSNFKTVNNADLDARYATAGSTAPAGGPTTAVAAGDSEKLNGKSEATLTTDILTAATAGDVGLGNVDNTADTDKPVSTAQQTALDLKQDASGVADFDSKTVVTDLTSADNTKIPTALAVSNAITSAAGDVALKKFVVAGGVESSAPAGWSITKSGSDVTITAPSQAERDKVFDWNLLDTSPTLDRIEPVGAADRLEFQAAVTQIKIYSISTDNFTLRLSTDESA